MDRFSHLVERLLLGGFLFCAALSIASQSIEAHAEPLPAVIQDAWRPSLASVRTLDEAAAALPRFMDPNQPSRQRRIADSIDRFLRQRFFHGYSHYRIDQNWAAWLAGKVWDDLAVPVAAEDILTHRRAACSQQALVFMALLARFGIDHAAVTFTGPGHFAVAARVDGRWLYYDSDIEPRENGVPAEEILSGAGIERIYDGPAGRELARAARAGRARLHYVNRNPAPQGLLFDRLTGMVSVFGWLLLGLAWAGWAGAARRLRSRPSFASAPA